MNAKQCGICGAFLSHHHAGRFTTCKRCGSEWETGTSETDTPDVNAQCSKDSNGHATDRPANNEESA